MNRGIWSSGYSMNSSMTKQPDGQVNNFRVIHWTGPIAQRLEPPAHNRPVPGSTPGGPTFPHRCLVSFSGQADVKVFAESRDAKADGSLYKPRCASAGAFFIYEC